MTARARRPAKRASGANPDKLLARAVREFNAMTPEQVGEMMRAQRDSWVRGEMALAKSERKTTRLATPPRAKKER